MEVNGVAIRPLDWKDTWQLRFGVEYRLSQHFALRAGYYHDPATGPDQTMHVLLPTFDFNGITAGFGYDWNGLSVNWGFEYLKGKNRQVTSEEIGTTVVPFLAMPGTYEMYQVIPTISVSYRF